jgi:NAD(P)-dependent dehydrogenase (short-subunit alcohol dehydrogenase family)
LPLHQNFARDYAPDKVAVNAVCPGEIHTPMLDAVITRAGGWFDPAFVSDFTRLQGEEATNIRPNGRHRS